MWQQRVYLVREPPACSAFTDPVVASSWSFKSSCPIDYSPQPRLLSRPPLQSPSHKHHVERHLSANSSSERGKRFRHRQKLYEEGLKRQVDVLRKQIAQLSVQRNLVAQNTLITRTSPCGSLVQLTRELYKQYQYGLSNVATTPEMRNLPSSVSVVEYKENFLKHLLDADVTYGTLVGAHSVIDQWRKHTASYAQFELEVMHIDPIDDFEQSPVVTTHLKQHARFSRETFPVLFPFVPGNRDDLMEKMVDREVTFDCVSRFQFSSQGQITLYLVEINFIEALIGVFGNAQDAAELTQLSVIAPAATLVNAKSISDRNSRLREPQKQAMETNVGSPADGERSSDVPASSKLSVDFLTQQLSAIELQQMTKARQYHNQPFLQFLDQVTAAQQREKDDNPSATIISTATAVAPSIFDHHAKSTISRHAKHVKSRSAKKTSSERGYTFRARKVQYEAQLVADVAKLRKDYAKLDFVKTLWQQKAMLLRNTTNGSLVRLTQEYFRILEHGLASCSAVGPIAHGVATQTVKYKENFIRQVLDPEVQFGDTGGIDAVIEQWRKYTTAFAGFQVKIGSAVMVHGSEENPGIEVVAKMRVGFTHDTFRLVFPGAVEREDLVCACVGKFFVLKNTHRLRFSSDGRIKLYLMDINFVEALGNAIGNLKTVSELLQLSRITQWNTIADVESGLASLNLEQEHQPEGARFSSVDSGTGGESRQRAPFWVSNLEMPFLLDDVPAARGKGDDDYMSQLREFGAAWHDDAEELLDR